MNSRLILLILTVASFFGVVSYQNEKTETEKVNNQTILFLGDIMLGRLVGDYIEKNKDPFLFVNKELNSFDFVIGNLEGPITDVKNCQKKPYSFKFATTTAILLAKHNISGVSLANNHSYDCYLEGFLDTKKYLTKEELFYFGGGKLDDSYVEVEIGDDKVIFIGIDQSIGDIAIENFYNQIRKISTEDNYIVVNIHWGSEYETMYSENQKNIAHSLIDSGADMIVGHHPHVRQPVEIYKGKPIFYSLGNFIFDQNDEETTKGYAVSMLIENKSITYKIKPYEILNTRPVFYSEENSNIECKKILKFVENREECEFNNSI